MNPLTQAGFEAGPSRFLTELQETMKLAKTPKQTGYETGLPRRLFKLPPGIQQQIYTVVLLQNEHGKDPDHEEQVKL